MILTHKEKFEFLKEVPIFKILPEPNLYNLIYGAKEILLGPNEVLFKEGSFQETMYVILVGKVEVYRKHKSIAIREAGEFFGEMAILESEIRSASVRGVSASVLLEISKNHFLEYLATNPMSVWEILKTLSQRTRETLNIAERGYKELKKSEKQYREIVQSVSDIIIQIDVSEKIVFSNVSVSLIGYEPKELIGKSIHDIIEPSSDEFDWSQIISENIVSQETKDLEIDFKVKQKSYLYRFARTKPFLVKISGLRGVPEETSLRASHKMALLGFLLIARQNKLNIVD